MKNNKIKFLDENGTKHNIRPTYDRQGLLVFKGKHYLISNGEYVAR